MDNDIKQDAFVQGLEQAAIEYWNESKYKSDLSCFPIEAFKAGGKWMAQHIYNAIKGIVENNPPL